MKGLVKEIMKKSGPKMILRHPYFTLMHAIDIIKKSPDLPKRKECKKKKRFV